MVLRRLMQSVDAQINGALVKYFEPPDFSSNAKEILLSSAVLKNKYLIQELKLKNAICTKAFELVNDNKFPRI